MLAIRLPETIEKRLDRLAKRTGRTRTIPLEEVVQRYALTAPKRRRKKTLSS
jgi:predicted DNA-binding protein